MKTSQFINNIPEDIRLSPLGHCKPLSELVLDPRVWEENGKIEKWNDETIKIKVGKVTKSTYKSDKEITVPSYILERRKYRKNKTNAWKDKMHNMIDARIDGKSLEEFISTL